MKRIHDKRMERVRMKTFYTPGEFRKISNYPAWFEKVNISKKNIYFFFGARFEK